MMNYIGNLQFLQKNWELLRWRISSFKTTSILRLNSYLDVRVINSIKNISLLLSRREFDNLPGRKTGGS